MSHLRFTRTRDTEFVAHTVMTMKRSNDSFDVSDDPLLKYCGAVKVYSDKKKLRKVTEGFDDEKKSTDDEKKESTEEDRILIEITDDRNGGPAKEYEIM